jgi:hypothetical protein
LGIAYFRGDGYRGHFGKASSGSRRRRVSAHNIPGSNRAKRWEDVQVLLDGGIHVWTRMNIQHLESLNNQAWQITGIRIRETIPDLVVQQGATMRSAQRAKTAA